MAVYAFAGKEIKPKPQQSKTWHAGEIKYRDEMTLVWTNRARDFNCKRWPEAFDYRPEISLRQSEVVCFGRDFICGWPCAFVS
jgi:hypothetical protein